MTIGARIDDTVRSGGPNCESLGVVEVEGVVKEVVYLLVVACAVERDESIGVTFNQQTTGGTGRTDLKDESIVDTAADKLLRKDHSNLQSLDSWRTNRIGRHDRHLKRSRTASHTPQQIQLHIRNAYLPS